MGDKPLDSPTMFLNLHQSPPHSAVQHHLTTTSDESDFKKLEPITNITSDRESFELVRRPRGRPPGSKNKQKPPVSSTNKEPSCMSPYFLEVLDGSDVIAAVMKFCNHRKTGLCVLSGSGTVCNVSIQQPTAAIFRGRFNLLSISATILPPSSPISTNNDLLAKFVVSLAGPDGRMFGGAVVGPLIASGTVYIIATTFNNPLYYRLPIEENDNHIRNSGYGSVSAATIHQSPVGSGVGNCGQHRAAPPMVADSLSMYDGHFSRDVIRALAQLQAPQHY